MVQQTSIIFFDIPTVLGVPISPYTWKVRLALNYKGLHYETHWIPSVRIEATCIALNIPPTGLKPSGEPQYTFPAIIDSTDPSRPPVVLSDSTPIIQYLDRMYPSPRALAPPGSEPILTAFDRILDTKILALGASLWIMDLYRAKAPVDRAAFRERMEAQGEAALAELNLQGPERERAWAQVEQTFGALLTAFANGRGGEYFIGQEVSFRDFGLCGCLIFIKNISPDDAWPRIAAWNGGKWLRYVRAFESWMDVDHHPVITE